MKKFEEYRYNMGDNTSDFSIKKKTSNSCVTCFVIGSIITLLIINNIYMNYLWIYSLYSILITYGV